MCGIVGAAAQRNVAAILLEGLKRLEYRGYDSAGVAIVNPNNHEIQRQRVHGKVGKLVEAIKEHPIKGSVGIAHTRWATHGEPNEINAHPHISHAQIAVVHNGIIENHQELRERLTKLGYEFTSQTDTEVISHLLHYHFNQTHDTTQAIRQATNELQGAYALGIINNERPNVIYGIRQGSPLVIGLGIDENFLASDPLALLPVTQRFIYLEEGDIATLAHNQIWIMDRHDQLIEREEYTATAEIDATNKGKYRHFMLKKFTNNRKRSVIL
jgi:glutamine---fructose-6-phosphate transaminase (isomerizing)